MLSHLEAYFAAERTESLVFMGFGLCAFMFSVFALWRWRDPLFKGMAIPLLVVGLIQAAVGATIHARTEAQVTALKAQYQAAPASFKTEELARMKAVGSGFTVYKGIEVLFIVVGLLLALKGDAHRFWRGLGVGMLVQGALMLPADLVAEDRADRYVRQIEAMP